MLSSLSVVVPTHNEGAHLRATVECLLETLPSRSEVIVIDDHSTDGSTAFDLGDGRLRVLKPHVRSGIAASRNLGAQHATGDVLVFCDAHVELDSGWTTALLEALEQDDVGAVGLPVSAIGVPGSTGYGFTWGDRALSVQWLGRPHAEPFQVPLLCGCFLALRRSVFEECGGFDSGLVTWGYEDAELSLRLWTYGYQCVVLPGPPVRHLFRQRFTYDVDWHVTLHNLLRVAIVHLGRERLARVMAGVAANKAFAGALAQVVESDVWAWRTQVHERRRHDDAWFLSRFGISVFD